MVDTVERLAEIDRCKWCDITSIDLLSGPSNNVEQSVLSGMGWTVSILRLRKDVIGDEVSTDW